MPEPRATVRSHGVKDRIVAAEVAMEDRLPSAACLFLSNIPPADLDAVTPRLRRRFLAVAKSARMAVT